ncbi:hypothetical protein BSNK01_09220 [Bacillaceae bacterium]
MLSSSGWATTISLLHTEKSSLPSDVKHGKMSSGWCENVPKRERDPMNQRPAEAEAK